MNKKEFAAQLRKGLSGLSKDDIDERVTFYGEMIDDRTEDGISEEEAVREIGGIDEIVSQIIADTSVTKPEKEKITEKRKLKAWEIAALVFGSPVWPSLLIAAFAVTVSVYAALWAVILALWAVFAAFAVSGISAAAAGIVFMAKGNVLTGIAVTGAGAVCAGLSVFCSSDAERRPRGLLSSREKQRSGQKNT